MPAFGRNEYRLRSEGLFQLKSPHAAHAIDCHRGVVRQQIGARAAQESIGWRVVAVDQKSLGARPPGLTLTAPPVQVVAGQKFTTRGLPPVSTNAPGGGLMEPP